MTFPFETSQTRTFPSLPAVANLVPFGWIEVASPLPYLRDGRVLSKDESVDEDDNPSEGVSVKKFEYSFEHNGVDSNIG